MDPRDFQAITIRRAILTWIKTGLKANRDYTPGNMARTAGHITGKKYSSSKRPFKRR
jgi:hypothetical protein